MPNSVLEAIKSGLWDFEPTEVEKDRYESTDAMPGSDNKLDIMAERIRRGLPLWHPYDRRSYDDSDDEL